MKTKINYLLLAIAALFTVQPIMAQSGENYLEGAVPEVEGRVVFAKNIHIPKTSKEDIFRKVRKWMDTQVTNEESKVVYNDIEEGTVVAVATDTLVFQSTFLSLDQSQIRYQIMANCKDNECIIEIDKITYVYEIDKRYTAEEMITDKVALNRAKTKVNRMSRKWRTHTVDFANKILDDAAKALLPKTAVAKTTTETNEHREVKELVHEQESPKIVALDTPVFKNESHNYKSIEPTQLPGNIIKLINDELTLVSIERDGSIYNSQLQNGSIGISFGKPTITFTVPMTSDLYKIIEKEDTYTISFYTEAYREEITSTHDYSEFSTIKTPNNGVSYNEAWLIIECNKTMAQSIMPDSFTDSASKSIDANSLQKIYVGEITHIWIK